jgi:hypothetical protein
LGAGPSDTILKGGLPKAPSILPSLVPIDPVVSEENIKIQKYNDGRPVVANAHMTLRIR